MSTQPGFEITSGELSYLIEISTRENVVQATFGGATKLLPTCTWAIEAVKKLRERTL